MHPQMFVALLFLAAGCLDILIAIPLIRSRIPRNHWYGVRVPKTLASDEIWYAANRYFGRDFFLCGWIAVLGSLLMLLALLCGIPLSKDEIAYIGLACMIVPLIIAMYRLFRFLNRF